MVKQHTCKVEGCEKVSQRTVCTTHYARFRRNGHYDLLTPKERGAAVSKARNGSEEYVWPVARECTKCHMVKTIDQFHIRINSAGEKRPYPHCKECHLRITRVNYERHRDEARAKRAAERAARIQNDGICITEGCEKEQHSILHALCSVHYVRMLNGVPMDMEYVPKRKSVIEGTDEFRRCTNCEEVKPVAGFYTRPDGKKQSQCKDCMSKNNRFNLLMREGRYPEALEKAQSMVGRLRKKNVATATNAIKEEELERAN